MRYTAEFVERGYNNRAAVAEHPLWLERWASESPAAYASADVRRDLRYGEGPKETLDLFVPREPARATFAFIHGGSWLAREGPRHGAPAPLVIAGHSAGGHLVAMMYVTDWRAHGFARPPFKAGVSLSGVHDLTPMPLFSFNSDIRLDDAQAQTMSPLQYTPTVVAPLLVAVGGDETSEFVRQARLLWHAWPAQRPPGTTAPLVIPGKHHFSVVSDYADPSSELTSATLALFGGG